MRELTCNVRKSQGSEKHTFVILVPENGTESDKVWGVNVTLFAIIGTSAVVQAQSRARELLNGNETHEPISPKKMAEAMLGFVPSIGRKKAKTATEKAMATLETMTPEEKKAFIASIS